MADEKIQKKEEQTGEPATSTVANSIVRNIVLALGGGLVTNGVATEEQLSTIAGAIVVIAGMVWSWWQKKKAAKRTQIAAKP